MTYDTSDALSENKYARTGYNFAGWSTTKGETSEYPDKVSVKNLTAENNGMSHYMLYGQRRKQSLHLIPVKMLFRAVNMTEQEKHIL